MLPEPKIQGLTLEVLLKALGLVRGAGVSFDLGTVVIPTLDITRYIAGLPAPLSPTLASADQPTNPAVSDIGNLWTLGGTIAIPIAPANRSLFINSVAAPFNSAVTRFELLSFIVNATVAVNIQVGVLRGMGTLGTSACTPFKPAGPVVFSVNFKGDLLSSGASSIFGATDALIVNIPNWPANTPFVYGFERPSLSCPPPYTALLGDGFVVSAAGAAAAGTVNFWMCVRVVGTA